MSTNPPPGGPRDPNQGAGSSYAGQAAGPGAQRGTGRCVEEAMERIEAELRQAVTYVNDQVVPHVRRESILAMRSLSETLRNLADRVERAQTPPRGPQS